MSAGIRKLYKKTRFQGMALVITLGTLVLVTVLILAFFSRAQFNRQVTYSSTNLLKANMLGRTALDIIVGEIRDEITGASNLSNGGIAAYPSIYFPATPADSLPRQLGVASGTGPLLKVSANNTAIRPGGTLMGSGISIDTSSRNYRLISSSRWYTSTTSSPQLGSQPTLPTWLFITRGNDVKTPASVDTAKDSASADYVIGRFAYTVYDLGSLVDVNVAGYPAVSSADAGYKSSAAYANLTPLGISSSDAADFLAWRNAVTGTSAASFKEWATGLSGSSGTINAAALEAARSGHREVAAGDNAVLSRRDLLKNASLAAAPKLLTHFSRSFNAPSASPATLTAANPKLADVRVTTTGSLAHYRDDGTREDCKVQAGDPLLQRRFSLAKLAWISHSGPNTSAFSGALTDNECKAAILACFGLEWDGGNHCWQYKPDGALGAIKTLGEVGALNREPNFFELLKAGIVEGSLGKASSVNSSGEATVMAYGDQLDREGVKDLQILKIGLNIIDCAKSDNYPSTIYYSDSSRSAAIHGIDDLPYLSNLLDACLYSIEYVDASRDKMNRCSVVVIPELFNPHRRNTSSVAGPSKIQIRIASGTLEYVQGSTMGKAGGLYQTPNKDLTEFAPIVIPSGSFENYRSGIKPVYDAEASSATTLVSQLGGSVITGTSGNFHGYDFFTYTTGLPSVYTKGGCVIRAKVSNLLIVMEYWDDKAGRWQIYDTLVGNEQAALTGISKPASYPKGNIDFAPSPKNLDAATATASQTTIDNSCWGVTKIDPRTSRFGVSSGNSFGPGYNQTLTRCGFNFNVPFLATTATNNNLISNVVYPGKMIQGSKAGDQWATGDGSKINNVADPDGVTRPADGWLDQSASAVTNLYTNVTNTTNVCRPIVLHRPFINVAELGYVFRDSPWKSLNFFDQTSGDGALLDLFSVADEPSVVAGKVALNATQTAVHEALLTGAAQNVDGSGALANPSGIASAYNSYAASAGLMPLNIAGLTGFMSSSQLDSVYFTSTTPIKSMRESVVRALAGSTQTRTWNLLVDVVAQTGRYPSVANAAGTLKDFVVEGESRYWLSIAIDRYTGKIISQQLEPVNE